MTIHLDHLMVPSRDRIAGARLLADLLGVPWSATGVGPFAPVYVNDGLTFDFDEWTEPFPLIHYCFRVSEAEFDAILVRIKAAKIPYRSRHPRGIRHATSTQRRNLRPSRQCSDFLPILEAGR